VLGKDETGNRVLDLLKELGIEGFAVARDDRPTTLKTRIIAHSQQIVRADWKPPATFAAVEPRASTAFFRYLPQASAVIVSDYDKGVVNVNFYPHSAEGKDGRRSCIPRPQSPPCGLLQADHNDHSESARGRMLTGMAIPDQGALEDAGQKLLEKFECEYALITCGEEGMALFDHSVSHHLPTFAREVFDVTARATPLSPPSPSPVPPVQPWKKPRRWPTMPQELLSAKWEQQR
jgi:D-beta-D-heptose 7-phosphate kinase/D-beta-D-heptose 1-phosphate adenosyltransferase